MVHKTKQGRGTEANTAQTRTLLHAKCSAVFLLLSCNVRSAFALLTNTSEKENDNKEQNVILMQLTKIKHKLLMRYIHNHVNMGNIRSLC